MQWFFDIMMLTLSCAIGFIVQRIILKIGSTFIMACVVSVVGVLIYYGFSWVAEWLSPGSRFLTARACLVYLGFAGYAYCQKEPPLIRAARFWLNLLVALFVLLLFLFGFLGCRRSDSPTGDSTVQTTPISVAAAHANRFLVYYPPKHVICRS